MHFFYKTFNIYNNQQKTQCSKLSSQDKRDHIFFRERIYNYTKDANTQTYKHPII